MDRRVFLKRAGFVSALLPIQAALGNTQTADFERYLQQQQTGFTDYQTQLEADFRAYQLAVNQEFDRYKGQINRIWGDQETGSAHVLVQYSEDMQSRTLIDYENATLTVEVIDSANPEDLGARIRANLFDTASATVQEAFERDILNSRIESRLKSETELLQTATPDTRPVIADVLTGTSNPDRRQVEAAVATAVTSGEARQRPAAQGNMQVYTLSIPLNQTNISDKAAQFSPIVNRYAAAENIEPALVLAIMHSESSFNPMARSHVPAYGLMQIVPESAGRDATAKIYGEQRLLAPSYLYNSENNIKIGAAYLNILNYRYLARIQNPESRLYCVIAAYNTGAGNVARAFSDGRNINEASTAINRLQPGQVYSRLLSHLPYAETKNYLEKVVPRYQAYLAEG